MSQELFDILYDYSINNKKANKAFVEYVIKYLITYYDVNSYIDNFEVISNKLNFNKSNLQGLYDDKDKIISIFLGNIDYYSQKVSKICNLGAVNTYFVFNSEVIATILHEFEHVLQKRVIDESKFKDIMLKKDNEVFLIYVCQIFYDKKIYDFIYEDEIFPKKINYNLYKKVYSFNPEERLAQINSLSRMKNILNNNVIDLDLLNCIFYIQMYTDILKGYKLNRSTQLICPSEYFFKAIGKKSIWKAYEFYDSNRNKLLNTCINNYDLNYRLRCGFPISYVEYTAIGENLRKNYRKIKKTK